MKKQLEVDRELVEIDIIDEAPSFVLFSFDGEEYAVSLGSNFEDKGTLSLRGKNHSVLVAHPYYVVDGEEFMIESRLLRRRGQRGGRPVSHGTMKSPMPGKILKIFVKVGQVVEPGTPILILEAMKMEHTIKASKKGTIEKIFYKEGDQVAGGVELVNVE